MSWSIHIGGAFSVMIHSHRRSLYRRDFQRHGQLIQKGLSVSWSIHIGGAFYVMVHPYMKGFQCHSPPIHELLSVS